MIDSVVSFQHFPIPQVLSKRRHLKWSSNDDDLLRELVGKYGTSHWGQVSSSMENRNPRQCQERWTYYLSPDVNNSPWSYEEDLLLFEKFSEYGTKWSQIAKFFEGRTNTNVKNRFLFLKRGKRSLKELREHRMYSANNKTQKKVQMNELVDAFFDQFNEVSFIEEAEESNDAFAYIW